MKKMDESKSNLAFTCKYETIPEPSQESDLIFKYARWLQIKNETPENKETDLKIERLYRIAAENNHYKANINLQNGALRGKFKVSSEELLDFSERLIDADVASGYYLTGIYLKKGSAGLQRDDEMSLRYFRKAADEGSALAQEYVANKLAPVDKAPDVARQMRRCAAEQGSREAALALGTELAASGQYEEAVNAYQLGTAAGDPTSASFLDSGFRGPKPEDRLHYLGQDIDTERADRYEQINKILLQWSYDIPVIIEIEKIVPLPPAKLPAWDGKIKWLEERKANIPPRKPSEELIEKLAKAKMLDPKTGRPLPSSPLHSK